MEELSKKVENLNKKVDSISMTLEKMSNVYSEVLIRLSVLEKICITEDLKETHANELVKTTENWKRAIESQISKIIEEMQGKIDEMKESEGE